MAMRSPLDSFCLDPRAAVGSFWALLLALFTVPFFTFFLALPDGAASSPEHSE
jgi:hypothetical protein